MMVNVIVLISILCCTAIFGSDDYDDEGPSDPAYNVGPRFEGDMLGFNNIEEVLYGTLQDREYLTNDDLRKWPNATVYYKISPLFTCEQSCLIHEAMEEMEKKACLKFVESINHQDYVEILPHTFYASYIAKQGGRQQLFLDNQQALKVGHVIHQLMHAIGFVHEQSRIDRDEYIDVKLDNVAEIDQVNFWSHGLSNMTTYGLPYDYDSIMHYGEKDFSKNNKVTIHAKNGSKIGQREKMSSLDIERINRHYKCPSSNSICEDITEDCRSIRNRPQYCEQSYYKNNCKKTCGLCPNENHSEARTSICEDITGYCGSVRNYPYLCERSYYKINCKKVCGLCPNENHSEARKSICKDIAEYCGSVRNQPQLCEQSYYYKNYCKKTCGLCPNENNNEESSMNDQHQNSPREVVSNHRSVCNGESCFLCLLSCRCSGRNIMWCENWCYFPTYRPTAPPTTTFRPTVQNLNCQTPEQRCAKWGSNHNCKKRNMKNILTRKCYQSCLYCW